MVKVLFICHGNICRSPMAEFCLKELVKTHNVEDRFEIASAAASQEEIGNGVYPPVKRLLNSKGVDCSDKRARQINRNDIEYYDYIIVMEDFNLRNLLYLLPDTDQTKLYKLLDFTSKKGGDIDDPWYTGEFERAYSEIEYGCKGFLNTVLKELS